MTTHNQTRTNIPAPAGRPAPAAAMGLPTLDPIKLLKRYYVILLGSVVAGAVIGVAAHVALLVFYPTFTPKVIFQAYEPEAELGSTEVPRVNEDEMERFMNTQVAFIKQDQVISAATNHPRIQAEAPKWTKQYYTNGKYNAAEAALDLAEDIRARVIPTTNLIELSYSWRSKAETTAIVRFVKEEYLRALQLFASADNVDQRTQLDRMINDLDQEIQDLQLKRDRLLMDAGVDSLDQRMAAEGMGLNLASEQLAQSRVSIETVLVQLAQMEEQLAGPQPLVYSDEVNAQVEEHPIILNLIGAINELTALQRAMSLKLGPNHRDMRDLQARLDGYEQNLAEERERLRRQTFDSNIAILRNALKQLRAQEKEQLARIETYKARLGELARISAQFDNYQAQIDLLAETKADKEAARKNLEGLAQRKNAPRITVLEDAQIPQEVSFPKWYIMVPLGVILVGGLTGGVIVLREMLDQRVKGPSDIGLIPRVRLLGLVPHGAEDPAAPKAAETAFRDQPRGVLAESFRQVRTPIVKQMTQMGYKTLLVLAGHPDSGASTVISNLASACAMADQKVLVVDANFRRPSQHRIFGTGESPGLADLLANGMTFDQVVCTTEHGVDILPVGSAERRVFERLSTDAMSRVLAEAASRYDLVLLDAPPATVSGDAMALANRCDASVLVVKAYSEKRGLVARLNSQLADTRAEFLGVLVNAVRSSAGGYFKRNIKATHKYQQHADAA